MKTMFICLICKLAIFVGKLLNRGSVLPGFIALKLDAKILYKLKLPNIVIAVTGSSGKGGTTKMLVDSYRNMGYTVSYNDAGSNIDYAITTCLINNSSITGRVKTDVIVLEIDERFAKVIFPAIKPTHVAITNITRDQPPRQGNVDIILNEICIALNSDMNLILNGDDPYLQKIVLQKQFKSVSYFGIKENDYTYKENMFENLNIYHCPKCHSTLNYDYYTFETNGSYHCSNCDFKRVKIDYEVTSLDYEKEILTVNNKYELNIPINILFSVYNMLSAFTVIASTGISLESITESFNKIVFKQDYLNSYKIDERMVHISNNKNENSTTFNQTLLYMERYKGPKTIVVGWKEISRRYEFNDLSWLYDITFEMFNRHEFDKVVCVGIQQYDIAVRMKLAGIDEGKIECFGNLLEAVAYIKKETKNDIFAVLNFDYVEPFDKLMKGE